MILPHTVMEIPSDMVDDIQFEMAEVPYDYIETLLRRACIEFCEQSRYWQENIDSLTMLADTSHYVLSVTPTKKLVSLMQVFVDGVEWERGESDNHNNRYYQYTPESIDFYPVTPCVGNVITMVAAIKPAEVDDVMLVSVPLLNDYRAALISHAKSALYRIPRKPWTDLQQAQLNEVILNAAVEKARLTQARGYAMQTVSAPVKTRPFY